MMLVDSTSLPLLRRLSMMAKSAPSSDAYLLAILTLPTSGETRHMRPVGLRWNSSNA